MHPKLAGYIRLLISFYSTAITVNRMASLAAFVLCCAVPCHATVAAAAATACSLFDIYSS